MFAKLLTAFTLASVGGVVGVGVVNEYDSRPVPAKSAVPVPVIQAAPPVIQTPPVLGQGPSQPGASDGNPISDLYAATYPGWKFWTMKMQYSDTFPYWEAGKPVPGWGVWLYGYGPLNAGAPYQGWERIGEDSGGITWKLGPPCYRAYPPAP